MLFRSTAEAKAEQARAKASLEDAEKELQELQFEHHIKLLTDSLSDFKVELQDVYDAHINELQTNFDKIYETVSSVADIFGVGLESAKSAYKNILLTMGVSEQDLDIFTTNTMSYGETLQYLDMQKEAQRQEAQEKEKQETEKINAEISRLSSAINNLENKKYEVNARMEANKNVIAQAESEITRISSHPQYRTSQAKQDAVNNWIDERDRQLVYLQNNQNELNNYNSEIAKLEIEIQKLKDRKSVV